jgi:hypothetical protein
MIRTIARALLPKPIHLSTLLQKDILKLSCGRVMSGPFQGLAYAEGSYGSTWMPKLLGTYEAELQETLETLLRETFDVAVVVGAAEGYYAVGLASRPEISRVVAFEPSVAGRTLMNRMIERNQLGNKIEVNALCDVGRLKQALVHAQRPFVVMDIEGAEAILLDPLQVDDLKRCAILVELHELAVPGVSELVRARFEPTHHIDEIQARSRTLQDFPMPLPGLYGSLRAGAAIQAMSERRVPNMSWLSMTPRRAASNR